jgi:uncharacterized UPF0160 family protein
MKIAIHDGSFHADEAFAVAAVQLLQGPAEVVRTRDRSLLDGCDLRIDVGMRDDPATGDFDHHQQDGAGARPNGIRYASFGLVWRHLGPALCGDDPAVSAKVDAHLVQGIDAHDIGQTLTRPLVGDVQPMTAGQVIGALNPLWDEDAGAAELDRRFAQAAALAAKILEREIAGAAAHARAGRLVREAIVRAEDPRLIVLERNMPWREEVVTGAPEALFVIYPKAEGWGMQAVPRELGAFGNRRDLPAAWAGRSDAELAEITGVPDAAYCHTARFFAAARTRDGIDALAGRALAHPA